MKIEIHFNKDKSFTEEDVYKGTTKIKCGNWFNIFSSCSGMIALTICLIILAVYCPKTNVSMDYLGAIVAILSLVVAVFVAAQIYQSFNLKKDIDEQNKELLEDMKSANAQQIEELINENKNLKNDFQGIRSKLEKLKADTALSNVFNYARRMDLANQTSYAIDGYIDALNLAIVDGLPKDRKNIAVNSISRIINRAKNNGDEVFILPNVRNRYFDVIANIQLQNDTTRSISVYLQNDAIETNEGFPAGELRVTSDYHNW